MKMDDYHMQLVAKALADLKIAESKISQAFNDELDRCIKTGDKAGARELLETLSRISMMESEILMGKYHAHRPFCIISPFVRDFIRYGQEKQ